MSVTPFYSDWADYNRRTTAALRSMSDTDLAIRLPGSTRWPIWAVAGHTAGMRVYWLCGVLGEPGADATPFEASGENGWEDDLGTARSAAELVAAFESTWKIVAASLERWSPEMLLETVERRGASLQRHSRQSVVMRIINHEAYHAGEISLALSANGREPIDLWPPADWTVGSLVEGS